MEVCLSREGELACVLKVKKFHAYLYGCHITLITDQSFSVKFVQYTNRNVINNATLSLTLASYEYSSAARPITQHDNVDAMSHLPLKFKPILAPQPPEFVLTLDTLLNSYYMLTDPDVDQTESSVVLCVKVRLAARVPSRRTENLLV